MSAPMRSTVLQLARSFGVSRRLLFQAANVCRNVCPELVKVAYAGLPAMKHCRHLEKALQHDQPRKFLAELPTMTNRQRHELLAIIAGDLKYRQRERKGGR